MIWNYLVVDHMSYFVWYKFNDRSDIKSSHFHNHSFSILRRRLLLKPRWMDTHER